METKPLPISAKPGEVLQELRRMSGSDLLSTEQPVGSISTQTELAEANLEKYLRNISNSNGAAKVVEDFYETEYGKKINASDYADLKRSVDSIDSILYEQALPIVSKEMLRDVYGVRGSPRVLNETDRGNPSLTPNWIIENENEPYLVNTTSGTTGDPWGRAVTRNDVALPMLFVSRFASFVLDYLGAEPREVSLFNVLPEDTSRRYISKVFQKIGFDVLTFSYGVINDGGNSEREAVERIIDHLDSNEYSLTIFPIHLMLEGNMGIRIRRGELDIDVALNGGAPFSETHQEVLESNGTYIVDVYGETEYPEFAMKRTINGISGFDLPFNTQINLVYDSESGELSYEGEGRFAYLPFGIEGQAVPGVYLSGVNCVIERVGNQHQLMRDIERVDDYQGCSSPTAV